MIANLLNVAGVNHVITLDLHATQMRGFFRCPVDNLFAEPLIARWIRRNVLNWNEGVVVSKNPGGTRRVTSLADALKVNFGIVTTDRRRTLHHSGMFSPIDTEDLDTSRQEGEGMDVDGEEFQDAIDSKQWSPPSKEQTPLRRDTPSGHAIEDSTGAAGDNELSETPTGGTPGRLMRIRSGPAPSEFDHEHDEFTDEVCTSSLRFNFE